MKALTLTQPWATLVALGAKKLETRSWATGYRGPIAIHAGKGLGTVGNERGLVDLVRSEPFHEALLAGLGEFGTWQLPRGAIIATAQLIDCCRIVRTSEGSEAYIRRGKPMPIWGSERAFGDYTVGRYAWLLANVQPLPVPISAKGALGLWEWTPSEGIDGE